MYRFKTPHMKNINIPKPCSENWNEMSPTEKGAFCQKCAIDVYDFTNKSGDEIRDILTLNIGGRVCGRIAPKQLDELNDDFKAWKITNKQSFNRAWIFSLLVVFGMTLFSCEEDEIPMVKEIQKTAQTFLSGIPEIVENSKSDISVVGDADLTEGHIRTGQFHVPDHAEVVPPEPVCIPDVLGEIDILGEIPLEPEEEFMVKGEMEYTAHIIGSVAYTTTYEKSLSETENPFDEEVKMSGLVFPNPATNQTTLKLSMPESGMAEIQLFTMAGQQVRIIHSGRVSKGETEYPINLTDLETGMYLIVILSEGKRETVKFSKL